MTKNLTAEFPHVERYFWTMVNQPKVAKILGAVKQTESVPPVQAAKKPSQPKETAKSKPNEEPKKEVKKELPKAEAQASEEVEDAPKPKAKNPLDLLPPSKMVLDEWKRLYSNTKSNFRDVAIKGSFIYVLFCILVIYIYGTCHLTANYNIQQIEFNLNERIFCYHSFFWKVHNFTWDYIFNVQ